MARKYAIRDQNKFYFVTFTVIQWPQLVRVCNAYEIEQPLSLKDVREVQISWYGDWAKPIAMTENWQWCKKSRNTRLYSMSRGV